MYATEDSGQVWKRVDVGGRRNFKKIYFIDQRLGWLIGEAGTIYRTADGGRTWLKQISGTRHDLTQIQFVGPRVGWVAGIATRGAGGARVLLTTSDGGENWQELRYESLSLYSFSFVNELQGWAVDTDSNILRTNDGGMSWAVQRSGKRDAWESIYFINGSEGWVAGDGILHTKDGGDSWQYQVSPSDLNAGNFFDSIFFSDRLRGWAVGFFSVRYTTDGGASWNSISEGWKEAALSKAVNEMSENR